MSSAESQRKSSWISLDEEASLVCIQLDQHDSKNDLRTDVIKIGQPLSKLEPFKEVERTLICVPPNLRKTMPAR